MKVYVVCIILNTDGGSTPQPVTHFVTRSATQMLSSRFTGIKKQRLIVIEVEMRVSPHLHHLKKDRDTHKLKLLVI